MRDTGANTVNVTIDLNQNKSGADLLITVAHEGSHVKDNLDYQGAMLTASTPGQLDAIYNGRITHGDSETRAYGVSSVFAEFTIGGNTSLPTSNSMGGTTFTLGGEPERSITVGGEAIWKSSWKNLNNDTIRKNRSDAIAAGLKKDKHYAPLLNTKIQP